MTMTVHVFRRDTCVLTGPMDDIWHSLINEYEYNAADLLVFDGKTGRVIDIDPNAPPSRSDNTPHEPARTGGRGRPKLGVVSKEVTLLPRHWDWLAKQRGGASATQYKQGNSRVWTIVKTLITLTEGYSKARCTPLYFSRFEYGIRECLLEEAKKRQM